jgi:hypothetical protein
LRVSQVDRCSGGGGGGGEWQSRGRGGVEKQRMKTVVAGGNVRGGRLARHDGGSGSNGEGDGDGDGGWMS